MNVIHPMGNYVMIFSRVEMMLPKVLQKTTQKTTSLAKSKKTVEFRVKTYNC